MDMQKSYHDNIQSVIKKYSYEFYLVKLNKNIKCKCYFGGTNEPDPECKRCLGTGYKIKIYPVHGASQTSSIPSTFRAESKLLITMNYYLLDDVEIDNDDIIVDKDFVYNVYQTTRHTGFHGRFCYSKVSGEVKKFDSQILLKNFYNIINKQS